MRTLLLASQQGGVGTTTAAVNLAVAAAESGVRVLLLDADPRRCALAALGLEGEPPADPIAGDGGVWADALNGLDAATPYADDQDPDECLAAALRAVARRAPSRYDLVVIDAPAGTGERAAILLCAADEVVVVERAAPESFKGLPTYLNAVRAARKDGASVGVRGVLVTLPEGVPLGGSAEAALRVKFRGLLPQAIPFDPAVSAEAGRPAVSAAPESPAARQFAALAQTLRLAEGAVKKVPAGVAGTATEDERDVGIFDAPSKPVKTTGRTETFYPDRRRGAGKGPDLSRLAAPPRHKRFSPVEITILAGSALAAVGAIGWFCLG